MEKKFKLSERKKRKEIVRAKLKKSLTINASDAVGKANDPASETDSGNIKYTSNSNASSSHDAAATNYQNTKHDRKDVVIEEPKNAWKNTQNLASASRLKTETKPFEEVGETGFRHHYKSNNKKSAAEEITPETFHVEKIEKKREDLRFHEEIHETVHEKIKERVKEKINEKVPEIALDARMGAALGKLIFYKALQKKRTLSRAFLRWRFYLLAPHPNMVVYAVLDHSTIPTSPFENPINTRQEHLKSGNIY